MSKTIVGTSIREDAIIDFIRNRMKYEDIVEFTLEDIVEVLYPFRSKRPRHVGRSVAWTLRNMAAKSRPNQQLLRVSSLGRGQKGVYRAKGEGWKRKETAYAD